MKGKILSTAVAVFRDERVKTVTELNWMCLTLRLYEQRIAPKLVTVAATFCNTVTVLQWMS